MEKKRPLSLTILSCYWSFSAIVFILVIVLAVMLLLGQKAEMASFGVRALELLSSDKVSGELKKDITNSLPNAVLLTILVIGLFRMKEWSRIGMLVYISYDILRTLSGLFVYGLSGWPNKGYCVGFTIMIVSFYYLTRPKVKEQFK